MTPSLALEPLDRYIAASQFEAAVDLVTGGQPLPVQLLLFAELAAYLQLKMGDSVQNDGRAIVEMLRHAICPYTPELLLAEHADIRRLVESRQRDFDWAKQVHTQLVLKLVGERLDEERLNEMNAVSPGPSSPTSVKPVMYQLNRAYVDAYRLQRDVQRSDQHAARIAHDLQFVVETFQIEARTVCHYLVFALALTRDSSFAALLVETLAQAARDTQSLITALSSVTAHAAMINDILTIRREQANRYSQTVDQMLKFAQELLS